MPKPSFFQTVFRRPSRSYADANASNPWSDYNSFDDAYYRPTAGNVARMESGMRMDYAQSVPSRSRGYGSEVAGPSSRSSRPLSPSQPPRSSSSMSNYSVASDMGVSTRSSFPKPAKKSRSSVFIHEGEIYNRSIGQILEEGSTRSPARSESGVRKKRTVARARSEAGDTRLSPVQEPAPAPRKLVKPKATLTTPASASSSRLSSPVVAPSISAPPALVPRSAVGRGGSSSTDSSSPIPPASPKAVPTIKRQSSRHKIPSVISLSPPLSPVQAPTIQVIREVRPKAAAQAKLAETSKTGEGKRVSSHQRNTSDVSHIALPGPTRAPAPPQTVAQPPPPATAPRGPSMPTQAPEPSPPLSDERVTRHVSIAIPPRPRQDSADSPVRKTPHPVIVSPSKEPETEDEAGFYTPRQSIDTLRGGSVADSSDDGNEDIPAAIMALREEHISPGLGAMPVAPLAPPLFTFQPPTPAEIKDPEVSPFHSESSSKTTSPMQSPPINTAGLAPPGASLFNPVDAFADAEEDPDAQSAAGEDGSEDEERTPARPPKSNLRNSPVVGNSPRLGASPTGSRTPSEVNSAEPSRSPSPNERPRGSSKGRSRSPMGSVDGGRPASRTSTTRSSQKHESQRYDDMIVHHRRPSQARSDVSYGGQSAREGSVRSSGALGKGGWAAAQAVSKSGRSSPVSMYMPTGGDGWEHFQAPAAAPVPPRQSKFTPLPASSQPLGFDRLVLGSTIGGSSVGDGYGRSQSGLAPGLPSGGSAPSEYSDDTSQPESGPQPSRSYVRASPTSPGPPVQPVLPHQRTHLGATPSFEGLPGASYSRMGPYRSGSASRSGSSPSIERWGSNRDETQHPNGSGMFFPKDADSRPQVDGEHGWGESSTPPPPAPEKVWAYPAALERRLNETPRMNGQDAYGTANNSPATIKGARMDSQEYPDGFGARGIDGIPLQHRHSSTDIKRQAYDSQYEPVVQRQRSFDDSRFGSESAYGASQREGPYMNGLGRVPVPYAASNEMLSPSERGRPISVMTDVSARPPSARGFDAPSLLNPDSLTLLPEMSVSDSERTYQAPTRAESDYLRPRHASMPLASVKRNASVRSRQSMSPSMLEREAEDVVYDLPQRRALSPLPGGRTGLAAQWESTSSNGEGVLMESNGRTPDSASGYTTLVLPSGAYTPVNPAKTSTSDINSRILGLPHTTMAAITLSSSLNRAAASNTPLHLRHQLPPPVDFSSHLKPPTKVSAVQLLVQIYAVAVDESDVRALDDKGKGEVGKWVPGRSFVGRCIMVGHEEKDLVRGDIVLGLLNIRRSGALSEYTLVDRRRIARAPQPSSLTLEQMALLPMQGIPAIRAARTHMSRSIRALIIDAHEGIAALVCQEMARAGVNVTAVIPGGEQHHEAQSACMANGARGVLTGSPAAVMLQLDEDGWDFIFDTVGGQRVYDTAKRILKSGAKLVTTVKPESNMLAAKNATVKASGFKSLRMAFSNKRKDSKFINFVYLPPAGSGEPEVDTSGVDIRDTLEEATMDAFRPMVGQVLPFERGAEAFRWTKGQIPAVVRLIN